MRKKRRTPSPDRQEGLGGGETRSLPCERSKSGERDVGRSGFGISTRSFYHITISRELHKLLWFLPDFTAGPKDWQPATTGVHQISTPPQQRDTSSSPHRPCTPCSLLLLLPLLVFVLLLSLLAAPSHFLAALPSSPFSLLQSGTRPQHVPQSRHSMFTLASAQLQPNATLSAS